MALNTTQIGMPLDEFLEAQEDQPFELLDGERLDKIPNVFGHTWYIRFLFLALFKHASEHQLGEVFSESTYAQMIGKNWVRGSRIPDIVFYSHQRIEAFKQENPDWRKRPLDTAPDLTIEVLSPTERVSDVTKKVRVDMAQGVRLTWAIDIENETATVYYQGKITMFGLEGALSGEDILPNFRLPLAEMFKKDENT